MNPVYDFRDKVVAVTGGAGFGLGNAIARAFFQAGAMVTICSRKQERVNQAVAEIGREDPVRAAGFVADMTVVEEAQSFVKRTVERFGRIDVLVNNAGVIAAKPSVEVTQADWDFQMNTKARGYFFTAVATAKVMIRQGTCGSIINIGSVNGECQSYSQVVYAAANAAVAQMTRCLAREWGANGIRVNCIQPGSIPTEINYQKYQERPELKADMEGKLPLGRRGEPKNIADAALFLASDSADYITGDVLNVDGGFLLYSI